MNETVDGKAIEFDEFESYDPNDVLWEIGTRLRDGWDVIEVERKSRDEDFGWFKVYFKREN